MRSLLSVGAVALADTAVLAREALLLLSPQGLQGTARRNAQAAVHDDSRRRAERNLIREVVEARIERARRDHARPASIPASRAATLTAAR